ncbi:MAG: T9SS type A sorting domain-containing protein [Bacteroidetes bacterium]|nr:T9SS type A sorting domain-containing protein [Bacteroidota bacterium]
MKKIALLILFVIGSKTTILAQACGVLQNLSSLQQSQIGTIFTPLDTALKHEDLFHIDSLSNELINVFGTEAGKPDSDTAYTNLVTNTAWLSLNNSVLLSRALIDNDNALYADLWKVAKGMSPPAYQPHSIFLRASAEIASGLLKIADKEPNITRKTLYQTWATRAFDSLATMQLPSGAFPFPDLRTYGDATFSSIIQNFLNSCGPDSVNVLQNGWIVDDKGNGEFKFDAGIIANAYYEAYLYTGNNNYKNIALSVGNYLKPLKFNINYNYNSFVSIGLTRAFQLTNDSTYLERAIKNIRYSVCPGQIANGRWVDGHNANSRYHSIIIQNIAPTIPNIAATHIFKSDLDSMTYKAVKNMVDYTYTCNAATGYRWAMKAYQLNPGIIPLTLKDSITNLIGKHINHSAATASFLDVHTMGEYLELLSPTVQIENTEAQKSKLTIFPNPTNNFINAGYTLNNNEHINLSLYDISGRLIAILLQEEQTKGEHSLQISLNQYPKGVYFIELKTKEFSSVQKIVLIN